MKYLPTIIITTVILFLLLSVISPVQADNIRVMFQIKSVGFDQNQNSYRLLVNISTNTPGHVVYLEEYYSIDSNSNPKFVSAVRIDGGDLVKIGSTFNASFEILRPVSHGGKSYTLVKAVIILNDKRVLEYWLTRRMDFVDNTGTDDDDNTLLSTLQNIDKYETRERWVVLGSPVLFSFSSLGVISEINVTGSGNGEVFLRVELLKGRSGKTDKTPGIAYRYIDMSADSNKVGEISLKYRVENSWMINRSIPENNLRLVSWDGIGKKWDEMPTKIIDKDSVYTYLESVSPGLSSFAIIGYASNNSSTVNKTPAYNTIPKQSNKTVQDNDTGNGKEPLIRNIPGFEGIIPILILLFLIRIKRRRN